MSSIPKQVTFYRTNENVERLRRAYKKQHGRCATCGADISGGYEFEITTEGGIVLKCKSCVSAEVLTK